MDNWDALYPFTSAEVNLFSRLHQKVTKFPAPSAIKPREKSDIKVGTEDCEIKAKIEEDDNDKK